MKATACYIYQGMVFVTKAVAKAVRDLLDKHSVPYNNATQVTNPDTSKIANKRI